MLVGAGVLCAASGPDIELVGSEPADSGECIEGSGFKSESSTNAVEVADANRSNLVSGIKFDPIKVAEEKVSGFACTNIFDATIVLADTGLSMLPSISLRELRFTVGRSSFN